jgi:serine phosphatase RsbU (regulator of sigma subunit)
VTPYELLLGAFHLAVGVINLLLGLVILREAPRQRLHQVTCILLLSAALGALLGSSSFLFLLLRSAAAGIQVDFVRSFAYLWEFFFPALLLLAAIYPRELPFLRRHRSLEFLIFVPHAFHFLTVLGISLMGPDLGLGRVVEASGILRPVVSVLHVFLSLLLKSHQRLFAFVNLTYVAMSLVLILRNLRASANPTIRRQLQTIFAGLGSCVVLYSIAYPIPDLMGLKWPPLLSSSILVLALVVGTGSIGYAVVRFKFLDLHRLVRRSILYATVTALLVGIYVAVVRYLGQAALRTAGLETELLDPIFLVLALIFFQPLLVRVETLLESVLLTTPTDHRQLLAHASRNMASTTDPRVMAEGIVSLLTEGFGLRGAAFLVADAGKEEMSVAASEGMDPDALAAVATRIPRQGEEWPEGGPVTALDTEARSVQRGECAAPALVVPVLSGTELLGGIVLGPKVTRTGFNKEEMTLLQTLAGYLALTLENLQLLEERVEKARLEDQLNLARRIQQSILPGRFPEEERVEMWGIQIPSLHVGGDYFDAIPLGSGRYALAIADVSGKGVPAALLMSMVAAGLRTLVQADLGVAPILSRLNRLLCQASSLEQFVTFFLALVDTEKMEISYANAGHSFPVLVTCDQDLRFLRESSVVLGVLPDADYTEERVLVEGGTCLLLYTDGVTEAEAPDGEMFGEDRLLQELGHALNEDCARGAVESIRNSVISFSGAGTLSDDLTLLLVRIGGKGEGSVQRFAAGEALGAGSPGSTPR